MYVEIFSSDILNLLIELFSSFLRIFYSSREISDRPNTKISKLFLYKLFSQHPLFLSDSAFLNIIYRTIFPRYLSILFTPPMTALSQKTYTYTRSFNNFLLQSLLIQTSRKLENQKTSCIILYIIKLFIPFTSLTIPFSNALTYRYRIIIEFSRNKIPYNTFVENRVSQSYLIPLSGFVHDNLPAGDTVSRLQPSLITDCLLTVCHGRLIERLVVKGGCPCKGNSCCLIERCVDISSYVRHSPNEVLDAGR